MVDRLAEVTKKRQERAKINESEYIKTLADRYVVSETQLKKMLVTGLRDKYSLASLEGLLEVCPRLSENVHYITAPTKYKYIIDPVTLYDFWVRSCGGDTEKLKGFIESSLQSPEPDVSWIRRLRIAAGPTYHRK